MKIILTFIFFLIPIWNQVSGQDVWEKWDSNYSTIDFNKLMQFEKNYADSIEKLGDEYQYYSRVDKYKINAISTGEFRPINDDVFKSMKRVFKLLLGKPERLDNTVSNEVLFKIGDKTIWMPIQNVLKDALKEEIKVGEEVILYCLFLNEHSQGHKIFNTFFISEFRKK